MSRVSIKDIANSTGFSVATVSIVLNGKGDEKKISRATQEIIRKTSEKLKYRPNYLAKSLKKGSSNAIGFLVPDIGNPFFGKLGRYIEELAWNKGFHCMFGSTDENPEKEKSLIEDFLERQVEGLILCSSDPDSSHVNSMYKRNFPLVLFDRADKERKCASVLIENKSPMKKAVSILFQEGYKKPGLMSITPDIYSLKRRVKGYREAIELNGIERNDKLVKTVDLEDIRNDSLRKFQELVSEGIDSLVFTNNLSASNVIWHIKNLKNPDYEKLPIVSFDNIELFDFISNDVISIKLPIEGIANECISQLLTFIDDENSLKKTTILRPEILNRIELRKRSQNQ